MTSSTPTVSHQVLGQICTLWTLDDVVHFREMSTACVANISNMIDNTLEKTESYIKQF